MFVSLRCSIPYCLYALSMARTVFFSELYRFFLPHAMSGVRFCFWRCDFLVCVGPEIYPERLNGFAPNSQGRCVWSLARTSLKVKAKGQGQGHQGQKTAFLGPLGGLREFYVW